MQKKKLIRIVLLLVLVLAIGYISARMQSGSAQPASSEETALGLTLVTAAPQTPAPAEETPLPEDGSYTEVEDVAYYLHTYGHLPDNYITKAEAEDAGWNSNEGNLWDVAYGMSIGGDRFGNYEGQLPKGEKYYEADVNYEGGYRGAERLIFSEDGSIYYTNDHYKSFTQLY